MRKKKQFSQHHHVIIIGIILLIIIKGITIANVNYSCGSADDICPSDYTNCMPCITEDPDCINSTTC